MKRAADTNNVYYKADISHREDFFSYLTDFIYFSVKRKSPKLRDTVRRGQKWPFGKGVLMVSAIFIDFQLFNFLSRIIPAIIKIQTSLPKIWCSIYAGQGLRSVSPLLFTFGSINSCHLLDFVSYVHCNDITFIQLAKYC